MLSLVSYRYDLVYGFFDGFIVTKSNRTSKQNMTHYNPTSDIIKIMKEKIKIENGGVR